MQVLTPRSRDDDIIEDYCDGSQFRTHPLFSRNLYALQFILYYDDMEVVNPLGSNTKTHKLGMLVNNAIIVPINLIPSFSQVCFILLLVTSILTTGLLFGIYTY